MAFLLGNEVDQWYICLEVCLGNSGLKKMEFTAIKDEVAEFLTKTERRKSKNTQNILLDGCYLLFEELSARKKTSVLYPKLCREIGQSFEESLPGGSIIVNY